MRRMGAYLRALICLTCAAAFLTGSSCGGEPGERTGAAGDSGTAGPGATGAAARRPAWRPRRARWIVGRHRSSNGANLFVTLNGKSQADVDTKLTTAVNRFFGIGTSEPTTPTADTRLPLLLRAAAGHVDGVHLGRRLR